MEIDPPRSISGPAYRPRRVDFHKESLGRFAGQRRKDQSDRGILDVSHKCHHSGEPAFTRAHLRLLLGGCTQVRSVQHAATRKHIVFSPRLFSTSHIFRRMVARMLPSCASMGARPVASACIKPRVQESKERKRVAKMCTVRVRSMHALGHATTRTLNTCTQYMI